MDTAYVFGWIGACFVLSSCYLKTMMPLRILAIGSNVAFIAYAVLVSATPILVLHCLLFPLNAWRLFEMRHMQRQFVQSRPSPVASAVLLAFMRKGRSERGTTLFYKGDAASHVYFVLSGTVGLENSGKAIQAGELFGLIGVLCSERRHTDSARCLTDVDYGVVAAAKFWELMSQNPAFGNHVICTVVDRQLTPNLDSEKAEGGGPLGATWAQQPVKG